LIDGLGGFGASWLRMLASWPVHFVPAGAKGRIAAVQAGDLGLAYAALAAKPSLADSRQANLGGTRHFAYAEYLQLLRGVESQGTKPALQIPLPNWMSRIGSHLCDLFRFSPFSYGHWILLQRDNLPLPNALPSLLGREPLAVTYTRVALKDDFRLS
jgi:NADH dehydrogenase